MRILNTEISKFELTTLCREIIKIHPTGHILQGRNKLLITALLEHHPRYLEKRGCGIKDIIIKKAIYGTKCFFIIRTDGSEIDFSFNSCINGKKASITIFSDSCRYAVKDIIFQKVKKYCSENNLNFHDYEFHHNPPFKDIVSNFINIYKIDFNKVDYADCQDGGKRFENKILDEYFIEYHEKVCNYKILKKQEHLEITKQQGKYNA